ncbi:MAG: cell division protein FtsZ [Bacteroidia bacterium]|nr:cell division protein FtsZ [Bacteroidia bacterium]MCX7763796.1 cell division protein FtsZ [Bacteroidia bacterium]MDW8056925.1 cell division protein FtsZ [Bacteroidia bacterium]
MSLYFPKESSPSIITVMGVGGAGCNAVSNMFESGIHGVRFVVCNTDSQVIGRSPVPTRLLIGQKLTSGLGCGADPELGRQAAEESIEEIRDTLAGPTRMVFLTAGLGGGTGTGALPVIAKLSQELGLLTVAVVTMPFSFEGEARRRNAFLGLSALEPYVDALVVVNNNNLLKVASKNMRQKEAFLMADQVLYRAVRGIAEVITKPGYINVDFADVRTVMKNGGYALLGMSSQRGENRALMAVEEALSSPLLDNVDIRGAKGILVNITASEETLTVQETEQIMSRIQDALGDIEGHIIMGQVFDDQAEDELSLTIIATGLSQPESIRNYFENIKASPSKSSKQPPSKNIPPMEMEIPLEPLPKAHTPPAISPPLDVKQRLQQLERDGQAIERARSTPAFIRYGINTPPPTPLSSIRVEPPTEDSSFPFRRNNPRLYDNAD